MDHKAFLENTCAFHKCGKPLFLERIIGEQAVLCMYCGQVTRFVINSSEDDAKGEQ